VRPTGNELDAALLPAKVLFRRLAGPDLHRWQEIRMSHTTSADDRAFRSRFEAGAVSPDEFDHRAHVRLAYVYLTELETDAAYDRMRDALHAFLAQNGVDPGKYHDTLTRAWVMAVRHFMRGTGRSTSADAFIEQNPMLLDTKIMLTHYSVGLLFSDEARAGFVEPDLDPIPRDRA
jgi:hypothetical protein